MAGLWDSFTSILPSMRVATPAPVVNGGSIAGYRNVDLSGFTPGGSAPLLENVAPLNMAGTTPPGADPTFMQSFLGYTNQNGIQQQGWGGLALGAASALGNSWMGMKQYGLAKDALKENKRQYEQNYAAQRTLTNSQLEDRQRARVASNPGAYQSVGEYMKQNGIK